jgi:general secretion pathway protein L
VNFYFSVSAPYRWASTDRQGHVLDSGVVEGLNQLVIPANVSRVVGVVPGEEVLVREVNVPSRNKGKIVAAAPYALEDSLASDVEDMHFAPLSWGKGGPSLFAVVARDKMHDWLDVIETAGIQIDRLIPEYFLLPIHPQANCTLASKNDQELVVRHGEQRGLVLDKNALLLWWEEQEDVHEAIAVNDKHIAETLVKLGGTNISHWNVGSNFVQWLRTAADIPEGNLLYGEYQPTREQPRPSRLWPAIAIAIIALAGYIGIDSVEYFILKSEATRLEKKINNLFVQAFPGTTRIVNVRKQMENKIAQLQKGHSSGSTFTFLLGTVASVTRSNNATIDDISYRDNSMQITLITADFASLDRIKQTLEGKRDLAVELLSSGTREQQVAGKFKLSRLRP